jgi:hypothetical protein
MIDEVMAENIPKYYFRGTTLGWEGNQTNRALNVVCTTSNPIKAALFALCYGGFAEKQVIYIVAAENITADYTTNVFEVIEDERAFKMLHKEFYNACDGYVNLDDMIVIIRDMGARIELPINSGNLNRHLKNVKMLTGKEMLFFIESINNKIKK